MFWDLFEICGAGPEESYCLAEEEDETSGDPQRDLKPEFIEFRDKGCGFARACLECPYINCIYDEPRNVRRRFRKVRDRRVCQLYKGGKDIDELAHIFRLSERTVFRITRGKALNKQAFKIRRGY